MYLLSILTFLICISINLKSQEYIPFPPDSTSEWRIDYGQWETNPFEVTITSYRMYFDGEIQSGNFTFHQLYADGQIEHTYSNGTTTTTTFENQYVGQICTDGPKVYFNYITNLIFDYSWQVGDTVKDCTLNDNCWLGNSIVITSIDSVEINGRYHRRYNFDSNNLNNISWFIEGIGHENGIWHGGCETPDQGSWFDCYAENGEPIFPEDANCILTVGTNEVHAVEQKFEIYPNPAISQITLSTNSISGTDVLVQVSDLTGRLLIKEFWKQNPGSNTTQFNLSTLKPGIYFITISGDEPALYTQQKLIIN